MYLYSGSEAVSAAALATANETANIAFALNLPLLSVPSNSIINVSISLCNLESYPINSGFMILFTFSTAFKTPLPPNLFSPSLNSTASWVPVEAPLGTMALPYPPPNVNTSTSTVGFPLESNTSLA